MVPHCHFLFKASSSSKSSCPLAHVSYRYEKADLWTVESGILGVLFPLPRHPLFQNGPKRSLGFIPDFQITHPLVGITGRKTDFVVESKWFVDGIKELESGLNLGFDLIDSTEDMG